MALVRKKCQKVTVKKLSTILEKVLCAEIIVILNYCLINRETQYLNKKFCRRYFNSKISIVLYDKCTNGEQDELLAFP